jgi:hypothetical protein
MKPPDETRNGDPKAAATHDNPAKDSVALGESVKPEQMAAWVDEAIATYRRAGSCPVEFKRLGLWLNSMRRALP